LKTSAALYELIYKFS